MPDLSHLPTDLLVLLVVLGLGLAAVGFIWWIWKPRPDQDEEWFPGPVTENAAVRADMGGGDDWLAADPPTWRW